MDYNNNAQRTTVTMHKANNKNNITAMTIRNVTIHNDYHEQYIKWITITIHNDNDNNDQSR